MLIEYLLAGAAAAGLLQDTDTTFAARGADRLDLENSGGDVVIEAWDRDEIRIVAEHSRRTEIEIRRSGRTVYVESDGAPFGSVVDYTIQLPRDIDVAVEGFQSSISIEGMDGAVDAEAFQGDVRIRGGSGSVQASSVNGRITLEDVRGRISAEGVSGSIVIARASGDISVETVAGSILMEEMDATSVEAETVGGRVEYSGTIAPDGDYYVATHSGRVVLELPSQAQADLRLSTLMGSISVDHPSATITEASSRRRSRVRLGNGGGTVEVETFSGRILIRESGGR